MAFKRSYRSKSRKAPKRAYKRKSYAPKRKMTAVKKIVRQEIARQVENKSIEAYNLAKTLVGVASATWQDNIIELGPNGSVADPMPLTNGTGIGGRIGNKVTTKKLIFKGTLVPLPYNAVTNSAPQPVQVQMVIFYDKTDPTAEPQPATNFFQQNGANTGFFNDLTDLWRPVNTDRYRVLERKTFKLGWANNNGTGATPAFQNLANNDFKMNCNFYFDLTKHYPKIVKFDDNSPTPSTRGLWCMFFYEAASGNQIPGTQELVGVQYMTQYVYEDA